MWILCNMVSELLTQNIQGKHIMSNEENNNPRLMQNI